MIAPANLGILTIVQKGTFRNNGNVLTLVLAGGTVYTVIKTDRAQTKINYCMTCKFYISFFNKQRENDNKDIIIKFITNIWLTQAIPGLYMLPWLKASHLLNLTSVCFISLNVLICHPLLSGWWTTNLHDTIIMLCGLQSACSCFFIQSLIAP